MSGHLDNFRLQIHILPRLKLTTAVASAPPGTLVKANRTYDEVRLYSFHDHSNPINITFQEKETNLHYV